jgi:hypothetical protein
MRHTLMTLHIDQRGLGFVGFALLKLVLDYQHFALCVFAPLSSDSFRQAGLRDTFFTFAK